MEREILFRGKGAETGRWVYGCGFSNEGFIGKIFTYSDSFSDEEGTETKFYDSIEVDPSTVGQYIGLPDKNGYKIFENDVVKTKYGRLCIIKWFSRKARWDMSPIETEENLKKETPTQWDLWYKENLEVVGNIYDNPEFLK